MFVGSIISHSRCALCVCREKGVWTPKMRYIFYAKLYFDALLQLYDQEGKNGFTVK